MQDLEREVLEIFEFDIPFYYRYVDDIVLVVSTSKIDLVFNKFNSIHPRLKFTIEIGNVPLIFWILSLSKMKKFFFNWFHKSTFSGRYLNYLFQHSLSQKKGTIIGLVRQAFLLSYPEFHQKKKISNSLSKYYWRMDYSLSFIFNTISSRIKVLINDKNR